MLKGDQKEVARLLDMVSVQGEVVKDSRKPELPIATVVVEKEDGTRVRFWLDSRPGAESTIKIQGRNS